MKKFNIASLDPKVIAVPKKRSMHLSVSPILEGGNSDFMKDFGQYVADKGNFDVVYYHSNKSKEIHFPVLCKSYQIDRVPESIRQDVADALNLIYRKCPLPDGKFLEAEFVAQ